MVRTTDSIVSDFIGIFEERFHVYEERPTRAIHLHRRSSVPDARSESLPSTFEEVIKGLTEMGFWGAKASMLDKMRRNYRDKWAMVLLDGSATVGYLYTAEDVANSCSSWPMDEARENYKVTRANLEHGRHFIGQDSFWRLLGEAGARW